VRAYLVIIPVIALIAPPGCRDSDSGEAAPSAPLPCVVSEADMAQILGRDDVAAVPQYDSGRCIYASDGQALVSLSVRTREQFDAERDRFESNGVKLPELLPVEGFGKEANIDPRYNSLNVTAGGRIISVEIVGTEPSDPEKQLELEKETAQAALESL
jgi:hypothetical protein